MNYHDASLLGIAVGIAGILGFSRLMILVEQYDEVDAFEPPEAPVMAVIYTTIFMAGFGLTHILNLPFVK